MFWISSWCSNESYRAMLYIRNNTKNNLLRIKGVIHIFLKLLLCWILYLSHVDAACSTKFWVEMVEILNLVPTRQTYTIDLYFISNWQNLICIQNELHMNFISIKWQIGNSFLELVHLVPFVVSINLTKWMIITLVSFDELCEIDPVFQLCMACVG